MWERVVSLHAPFFLMHCFQVPARQGKLGVAKTFLSGRGIHITKDMCFLVPIRGTHITRDKLCVSWVGEHILLGICVSQGGEHILLGICVSLVGEHITRNICFLGRETHITSDMCVSQVGEHSGDMCFLGRGTHTLYITRGNTNY